MTPADAARILGTAAVYDRRTVGELDARAWADALDDLDPCDCADAVRRHYRDSTAWLMPARVRELVTVLRRERKQVDHDAKVLRGIAEATEAHDRDVSHKAYLEARAAFDAALAAKHEADAQAEAERARAVSHPTLDRATGTP